MLMDRRGIVGILWHLKSRHNGAKSIGEENDTAASRVTLQPFQGLG